MNKKGIFMLIIFIVGFLALSFSYIVFSSNYDTEKQKELTIGKKQFSLIQKYNQGERLMLNIEQAARISSAKAAKEFYANLDGRGCSKVNGYAVLNDCAFDPTTVEIMFIELFKKNFDEYLRRLTTDLTASDYSMKINKGFIEGFTEKKLNLSEGDIEYYIAPDFRQKVPSDLGEVFVLLGEITQKQECLSNMHDNELDDMNIAKECGFGNNYAWRIMKKNGLIFFDVAKKERSKLVGNIEFKFAISLKTSKEPKV